MYPPGLELHGSTWRVTKRVPADLLHCYPTRHLRRSTHQSDKREAAKVAWVLLADLALEFDRLRSGRVEGYESGEIYDANPKAALEAHARHSSLGTALVIDGHSSSPKLSEVVASFLSRQDQTRPMYRKYKPVLGLLLDVLGDLPVHLIRQKDIDEFFGLVCRLPPRWVDYARKRQLPVKALTAMEWGTVIAPKTFEDTYVAAVRPFLQESIRLYGDQGFPYRLTVDGIKYTGNRKAGENKQRALSSDEIRRLFTSSEYLRFTSEAPSCFWLPLVGLLTGARVNEVCQLNPQCDIREEGGIWFFDFTEDSDGEAHVVKSVKTANSKRRVPIHSTLITLGFLSYVEKTKATGAKLLFPKWRPERGKASAKAEDWFRQFLAEIGLRDETPFARVVGFHCFRSTFAARAQALNVNEAPILGHADDGSAVQRGYRGKRPLPQLQGIVEAITFEELNGLVHWVKTRTG